MSIKSRIHTYGDEKESSWPPQYPEESSRGFVGYWDHETQTFKEGYPPDNIQRFGEAPAILTDEIKPFYHEKAQKWCDTRSALRQADLDTNCTTVDRPIRHDQALREKEYRAKRSRDRKISYLKGLNDIKTGNSPVCAPDWAAKKAVEADKLSAKLGVDLRALPTTTERKTIK